MENPQGNIIYRNLANAISILGVLPLAVLFLKEGYNYSIPLIIFNNVMDDLDGVLAGKLKIRSRFGADLDNVCDAVAHSALALVVGAHFGGWVMVTSTMAAVSLILRATSRLNPDKVTGGGSPTNELMRHLLFVLLVAQCFDLSPELYLILIFSLHAISMNVPFRLPVLIRGLAKTATTVFLVNVALVAAWLLPSVSPFIAMVFIIAYLYSFVVGGVRWLRGMGN